jgi:hypothetical protein
MNRSLHTYLLILLLLFFACSHKAQSNVADKSLVIEALYELLFTADDNFCNPSQIMRDADDCDQYYYFTKKGKVFFKSQCEDTTSYLIGKYSVTSQGVTCRFNSEYFYISESKGKQVDSNSGKIKKINSMEFKLAKLNCEYFDFHFVSGRDEKHVLRKSTEQDTSNFFSTFNKIKAFARY